VVTQFTEAPAADRRIGQVRRPCSAPGWKGWGISGDEASEKISTYKRRTGFPVMSLARYSRATEEMTPG
jgi:hypothetical protein